MEYRRRTNSVSNAKPPFDATESYSVRSEDFSSRKRTYGVRSCSYQGRIRSIHNIFLSGVAMVKNLFLFC